MKRTLLAFLTLSAAQAEAQTPVPTWSENVACILYSNCTSCHHDGGIAPFSLMTYQEANAASFGVMGAVNSGSMPPWPPDRDYRQFAHERYLTQQEKDIITAWVNGGTPEGDPGLAPPMPVYVNPEDITDPDLVLTIPNYTINSQGSDVYRCFAIPTSLATDVYITDLEVVPDNRSAVHHVLVYADESPAPLASDAADPLPGYNGFGGTGSSTSKLIGAWVPGQSTRSYPDGMGLKLPAGSTVVMQVHYPASANGQQDQTKVNIKYTSGGFIRELFIASPLSHAALNEGFLAIPPNETRTFTANYAVPAANLTVLDVSPHMHLIGKSIKAWATTPTLETINLIDIPEWDFHWQGFYEFRQPVKIPAGTILSSSATYDNTSSNPHNPSNPPAWVFAGENTTDEMMLVYFTYTIHFPGDEDIVIDTSTVKETFADCYYLTNVGVDEAEWAADTAPYPNPSTGDLTVPLPTGTPCVVIITDAMGRKIREFQSVSGNAQEVKDLRTGVYTVTVLPDRGAAAVFRISVF